MMIGEDVEHRTWSRGKQVHRAGFIPGIPPSGIRFASPTEPGPAIAMSGATRFTKGRNTA